MSTKLERVIALDAQIRTTSYPHTASLTIEPKVSELPYAMQKEALILYLYYSYISQLPS